MPIPQSHFTLLLPGGGVRIWVNGTPAAGISLLVGAIGLALWLLLQLIPW